MQNPFEAINQRLSTIESLLSDIHGLNKTDNSGNEILSIQQAMELTHLAKQTIYGLVSSKRIPFFKKGKKLYFKKDEVLEWLESERN